MTNNDGDETKTQPAKQSSIELDILLYKNQPFLFGWNKAILFQRNQLYNQTSGKGDFGVGSRGVYEDTWRCLFVLDRQK